MVFQSITTFAEQNEEEIQVIQITTSFSGKSRQGDGDETVVCAPIDSHSFQLLLAS